MVKHESKTFIWIALGFAHLNHKFARLSWMLAVALASSPFLLLKQELLRLALVLILPTKFVMPGDWG